MSPLPSNKRPGKICVPIVETKMSRVLQAISEANPLADLIELRMDYLANPDWERLFSSGAKPFIVTNRRREEGGRYAGSEKERLAVLREAISRGAAYVDVEMKSNPQLLSDLRQNTQETRLVLSSHNFRCTPSTVALLALFRKMMRYGPEVIKIATWARTLEDNIKILALLSYALRRKQKIVALCMGEQGKMSRIFSPLWGALWTYASLDGNRSSAPGQVTARDLLDIWERI